MTSGRNSANTLGAMPPIMDSQRKPAKWMEAVAGGCAGFVEVSINHPLDVIKTRFQIQRGPDDPNRYNSLVDCFKKMYRNEGALSFYKGILPPLMAETPKRAVKFFTFERYKDFYSNTLYLPITWSLVVAGLCSGLTEAFVINPFEVVKVKLQAERDVFKKSKTTFSVAREIVRKDGFGLRGLNKGLTATLGRHGVFNMIYFGFYHNVKAVIPEADNPSMDLLRRFTIGLTAGLLGATINIPFDVAKSRIQGPQPVPGQIKYRKCFATILMVYREEGYMALFKGWLPKVLRLGPGGAIMLLVYEAVVDVMKEHMM